MVLWLLVSPLISREMSEPVDRRWERGGGGTRCWAEADDGGRPDCVTNSQSSADTHRGRGEEGNKEGETEREGEREGERRREMERDGERYERRERERERDES